MLSLNTLIQENTLEIQIRKLIKRFKTLAQQKHLSQIETDNRVTWVLRFLRFHNNLHPVDLNQSDVESFLSSLATEHNYDYAIQNNAVIALRYLYRDFLSIEMNELQYIQNKSRKGYLDRYGKIYCRSILNHLQGTSLLMTELVVSGRLKLNEVVNLKLTDVNIKKNRIHVRRKNGEVKFILNIPIKLILDLRIQMMRVRQLMQIKTQQFSKIAKSTNRSKLNPTSEPLGPGNDEYLFPIANRENPYISSRAMQLALLKNDIRIATKQHLRFSKLEKSIQLFNPLCNDSINKQDFESSNFPEAHQWATIKKINLERTKSTYQGSFNFQVNTKPSDRLTLGAA